jgi:TonB family protein
MKTVYSLYIVVCVLGMAGARPSALGQNSQPNPSAAVPPSQFVAQEHIIKHVDPVYPKEAKLRAVQGTVVLTGTIAADGTVKNIKVINGDPILRGAAVDAVSQWRYEPYRVEGVATDVNRTFPVTFTMGLGTVNDAHQVPQGNEVVTAGATQALPPPAASAGAERVFGKPSLPLPPAGVMRVSGRVMAGQLEKKVDPVYPVDSIAVDARGDVVLLATIKKTGEVGDVQAVSGPYRFRDAAIDAVKQWQYRPYEVDGAAVDVQATITLNFAPPPTGTAR